MASGTLLIGDDMLINNLRVKAEEMNEKAAKALKDAGGKIISSSIKRTPIKTGELRKRSFNEGPLKSGDSYVQVVGYEKFGGLWESGGTAYAVEVHENLEARHSVGESQFLKKGVEETSAKLQAYLAKEMKI
ncbi:MAG: hypothetical protein M0P69_16865 [Bacteroidales bacterium]|nr:hypothetical protein [Bacteroidales bacterium]